MTVLAVLHICCCLCNVVSGVNPLYSDGLFHPYKLEKSICYLRCIRCNFLGLYGSRQKLLLANSEDTDQMPHYAASDLGLHCLPMYPF